MSGGLESCMTSCALLGMQTARLVFLLDRKREIKFEMVK